MTVERFAISFDKELARLVRRSAANEPTSSWLADAARRKLRAEGLLEVVRDWERVHGELTAAEVERVASEQRSRPRRARASARRPARGRRR